MRCLAVCQTELVVRMLETALAPSLQTQFLVESRPLARRLHEAGIDVSPGDLNRTDTYLKADLDPTTCVIVEDNHRPGLRKTLTAISDAGATLVYVLGLGKGAGSRREGQDKCIKKKKDTRQSKQAGLNLNGGCRSKEAFHLDWLCSARQERS